MVAARRACCASARARCSTGLTLAGPFPPPLPPPLPADFHALLRRVYRASPSSPIVEGPSLEDVMAAGPEELLTGAACLERQKQREA